MKRVVAVFVTFAAVVAAQAAVFERFLSPDRPVDRAIMAYVKLANAGEASSRDLTELAVLLVDKGFPKDAETYLRQALKLDKRNFDATYRLGLVLQRLGRDGEAVRAYKRALKVRPGHSEARFMLALAEERCGERAAAIRDYAKVYHHNPNLADPDKNPLVYDSALQTEAELLRYRQEVNAATLKVEPVDPAAVKRMMEAKPSGTKEPEAPVPPVLAPTPAAVNPPPPAAPTPTPAAVPIPQGAPIFGPPTSQAPKRPRPGLPGGLELPPATPTPSP